MQNPTTAVEHFFPSAPEAKESDLRKLIDSSGLELESIDLFALLRHVDAKSVGERLGYTHSPSEDTVRLGQFPSTAFAPSTIHSVEQTSRTTQTRLKILSFGLFGPNGALPLHLTEYMRERLRNHADRAPSDFVDLFHHRLISLFYRAWADAQSVVQLDHQGVDKFSFYLGSLIGMGFEGSWNRDTVEDSAKLHGAGHLIRQTRNPEGLEKLLGHYFNTDCRVQEFMHSLIPIPVEEQTRLTKSGGNNSLGSSAIAGQYLHDVQSRFRLRLGSMSLTLFESFLPPYANNRKLRDWVRDYIGIELEWDVQLLLNASDVPSNCLGGRARLGWTSWLGSRRSQLPANDLLLNPEADGRRVPEQVVN